MHAQSVHEWRNARPHSPRPAEPTDTRCSTHDCRGAVAPEGRKKGAQTVHRLRCGVRGLFRRPAVSSEALWAPQSAGPLSLGRGPGQDILECKQIGQWIQPPRFVMMISVGCAGVDRSLTENTSGRESMMGP